MAVMPPRPLAETDDRTQFDCGRNSLNHWFRRHAWANHAGSLSRVNVLADASSQRIIGYVTLSAAQIERAYLPKPQRCNRPDPVPATLLGQLGVDKDYQGKGHASCSSPSGRRCEHLRLSPAPALSRIRSMTACAPFARAGVFKTCPLIRAAPYGSHRRFGKEFRRRVMSPNTRLPSGASTES